MTLNCSILSGYRRSAYFVTRSEWRRLGRLDWPIGTTAMRLRSSTKSFNSTGGLGFRV